MYKIKSLTLTNFKFFYGEKKIDLERKNLLIYGENGSGKSSLYWALYTFLQSVFKDTSEIRKYFDPKHIENLINRYGFDKNDSSIRLELEDDDKDLQKREISIDNITTKTDNFIKEMTLGSDFINHHTLSRIYAYYHKEEINLFDIFEHELLAFITFKKPLLKQGEPIQNANVSADAWWDYISDNIPKLKDIDLIKDYIKDFNGNFENYLNTISELSNTYITQRFNEKFNIRFEYQSATYPLPTEGEELINDLEVIKPKIIMTVKMLDDKIEEYLTIIDSPQSFLNEARLSTIALSLRLAILDEKYVEAYPKILVLDDMLLSLDMSNREFILKVLFDNYLEKYQILFFTHQRGLFEDVKKFVEAFYAEKATKIGITNKEEIKKAWEKDWKLFEMYETENENKIPIPQIQPYESSLQKALMYFKNKIDYNACGNNLRMALEEYFREFIPHRFFVNGEGNPIAVNSLMLDGLLVKGREYFTYVGFDTAPIDKLDRYRTRSLNPSSHYNPRTEYFKKELQDIFSIIEGLNNNRNEPLLSKDEKIKFAIRTEGGKTFLYTAILLDDITLYKKSDGTSSFFKDEDERGYVMFEYSDGTSVRSLNHQIRSCTLQILYNETVDHINRSEIAIIETDMYQVFTDVNGKTLDSLKKY